MKYINKTTGSIIESDCELSGGDWEAFESPSDKEKEPKGKKNTTKE